jgi:hypothetical protein
MLNGLISLSGSLAHFVLGYDYPSSSQSTEGHSASVGKLIELVDGSRFISGYALF